MNTFTQSRSEFLLTQSNIILAAASRSYIDSTRDNNGSYGRSNKKTNALHEAIEKIINNIIEWKGYQGNFTVVAEKNGSGRQRIGSGDYHFNVDLKITDKTGNLIAVFLVKAPISSINKNIQNYRNNKNGEICRVFSDPDHKGVTLFFLSICPVNTFIKKGKDLVAERVTFLNQNMGYEEIFLPEILTKVKNTEVRYSILNDSALNTENIKTLCPHNFSLVGEFFDGFVDSVERFFDETV